MKIKRAKSPEEPRQVRTQQKLGRFVRKATLFFVVFLMIGLGVSIVIFLHALATLALFTAVKHFLSTLAFGLVLKIATNFYSELSEKYPEKV